MPEPVSIRLIHSATAPPWFGWAGWWRRELRDRKRRGRARLQDLGDLNSFRDWRLRPGPPAPADLAAHAAAHAAFYAPNQIRHIIRWEAGAGNPGAIPTPPPSWSRDTGRTWRPWPDVTHIKLEPRSTTTGVSREAPAAAWWVGAGRGLPLGAALLAAILLLLRAADRCLHTKREIMLQCPRRRRQSEEWPTPNVMATNLAVRMNEVGSNRPPSPLTELANERVDLPPPYSECAEQSRQKPDEEPPPPYSSFHVAYFNPKNGTPFVNLYTQRCQNLIENHETGPSSVDDTGQSEQQSLEGVVIESADAAKDDQAESGVYEVDADENGNGDAGIEVEDTSVRRDRHLVV